MAPLEANGIWPCLLKPCLLFTCLETIAHFDRKREAGLFIYLFIYSCQIVKFPFSIVASIIAW